MNDKELSSSNGVCLGFNIKPFYIKVIKINWFSWCYCEKSPYSIKMVLFVGSAKNELSLIFEILWCGKLVKRGWCRWWCSGLWWVMVKVGGGVVCSRWWCESIEGSKLQKEVTRLWYGDVVWMMKKVEVGICVYVEVKWGGMSDLVKWKWKCFF